MFLDKTYFQGELYLPNLGIGNCAAGASPSGVEAMIQTVGENTLEWFVEKYEREFLLRLLGKPLYDAFVAGMGEAEPEARWVALKEAIYQKGKRFSFSPAANYVFYWVSRRGRTQTSINGEVRGEQDHARIAHDADKLAKVWNDMIPMADGVLGFLDARREDYAEFRKCVCGAFRPINTMNL